MTISRVGLCSILLFLVWGPASADEIFSDDSHGGRIHTASGFICPARIGPFHRDAVGERDPEAGTVYCAYSKLDGVYGTIVLKPARTPYDARSSLAGAFEEAESTGGRMVAEQNLNLASTMASTEVFARTYETAKLQDEHYRVLYAGAEIGNWAVELTVEYADPRDVAVEKEFLDAVYAAAETEVGKPR